MALWQLVFGLLTVYADVVEQCEQCLLLKKWPMDPLWTIDDRRCAAGRSGLVGPADYAESLPNGIQCCATKFGERVAECATASCAQNFGGLEHVCANYGVNASEVHASCPYATTDRAICDVSYYVLQNEGSNCRTTDRSGNCLGKVKCNTDGVELVDGHSDGIALGGGGQCAHASAGFAAGADCFYDGQSEKWKVCGGHKRVLQARSSSELTSSAQTTLAGIAKSMTQTKAPSVAPSRRPTRVPTDKPSKRPSAAPSTKFPTSRRPTTPKPTRRPTTPKPTRRPTTARPTRPTQKPTTTPTAPNDGDFFDPFKTTPPTWAPIAPTAPTPDPFGSFTPRPTTVRAELPYVTFSRSTISIPNTVSGTITRGGPNYKSGHLLILTPHCVGYHRTGGDLTVEGFAGLKLPITSVTCDLLDLGGVFAPAIALRFDPLYFQTGELFKVNNGTCIIYTDYLQPVPSNGQYEIFLANEAGVILSTLRSTSK